MTLYGYQKNTPSGSKPATQAWSPKCDVGNTLVVIVSHQGANVVTAADSVGNTWTKVADAFSYSTPAVAQQLVDLWVCVPTTALTASTVVTFTAVSATAYWVLQAKDYVGALTVRAATQYAGAVSGTSANIPANAGDLLVTGAGYGATTAATQDDTVSGWAADGFNYLGTTAASMWEKTATTTGTQGPSYTVNHSAGIVHAALYVPSVNAGPAVNNSAATVTATTASPTTTATITDDTGVTTASYSVVSATQPGSPPTVATTFSPALSGSTKSTTATATISGLVAGHRAVIQLTAGDGITTTTGAPVTIYYAAASVGPVSVISNAGGWVAVNAASLQAAVNKSVVDDSSYAETPASPSGASIVYGVGPILPGDETVPFRAQYYVPDGGAITSTFKIVPKLYSGGTLVTTGAPVTLTNSFANYTLLLSPSENAAVANRNDVRIELVATQS